VTEGLIILGFFALVALVAVGILLWELHRARTRGRRMVPRLLVAAMLLTSTLAGVSIALDGIEGPHALSLLMLLSLVGLLAVAGLACVFGRAGERVATVLVIAALAGWGGYLAAGYGEDDRDQAWHRWHLEAIQGQLQEIRRGLEEFKQAYGRFPTNDEGLAVLPQFASRFAFHFRRTVDCEPGDLPGLSMSRAHILWDSLNYRHVREAVTAGELPTSEEELRRRLDAVPWRGDSQFSQTVAGEVAFGRGGEAFLLREGQVLSPWWMPHVYENRQGLSAGSFAGSPADGDSARRYSIELDDQVYVSSVGGQVYAEDLERLWWTDVSWRAFGVSLILLAGVLVLLLRRVGALAALGALALVASALGGVGLDSMSRITCYAMMELFGRRSTEMVARREKLLRKHRDAGVISRQTYEKALASMKLPAGSPPTTMAEPRNDGADSASD